MTLRLSPAEHGQLESAAVALGVETGGLAKAAALRGLAATIRDVEAGDLRLRRRSVAASSRAPEPEREPVVVAPVADPGVLRALQFRRMTGQS